ncbi:MAG: DoxX family protein [Candidatus Polarisedimenticolia bacterium]
MLHKLLDTRDDPALAILRIVLGVTFFAHGAQKVLGWFGGPGFQGTLEGFGSMGLPAPLTTLVMAAELGGAILLLIGLLSRVAAAGIAAVMVGAILMVHRQNGFFMNWMGQQAGEGFEYHLLVLAIAAALMLGGGGALSADLVLSRQSSGSLRPVLK